MPSHLLLSTNEASVDCFKNILETDRKLNSYLREGESRTERKNTENEQNGKRKKRNNLILQVMLLIKHNKHTKDVFSVEIWKKKNAAGIKIPIKLT